MTRIITVAAFTAALVSALPAHATVPGSDVNERSKVAAVTQSVVTGT